jgi:DNA primase large subunit
MELASALSIEDYAKYPFLKKASTKIQELELTIQSIVEDRCVLDRAQNRVEKAILEANTGEMARDKKTEISAYAASMILVIATKNSWIKKRYALAVAKTAYSQIRKETTSKAKIFALAQDFDWDLSEGAPYKDFQLGFTFYLKNSAHLHDVRWKLVNQIIDHGKVYINKDKAARLLQEEIKNRVEKRLDTPELKNLPEDINLIANNLSKLAQEIMGQET